MKNIRVGLEFGYNKLFTDYLDDVSKTYVDAGTLSGERGQTAVDLAYRGYEVGSGPYPAAGAAVAMLRIKMPGIILHYGYDPLIHRPVQTHSRLACLPA